MRLKNKVCDLFKIDTLITAQREFMGENRFLHLEENVLEQTEVVLLCRQVQEGNRQAMECLLTQYRPLMVSLARKWSACPFEDALQEAHVAVIEAAQYFDPTVGCYFGVFLRQRVRAHLRTWGRRQMRWSERHMVASYSREGEDDMAPIEEWGDESATDELKELQWKEWLEGLSPREQLVLERQMIAGYTLAEIAAQELVSHHTVNTWKKRAMQKLRKKVI